MARPGFDRLVAELCAGTVGAVLCLEASRLARNGRDWHHLLELCGLVEARVIDLDGIYNPCLPNDRLLLGMKGSISEFELGLLRARLLDAAWAKARRGELRIPVPTGFVWDREAGIGFDPDLRIQEVIRLVFKKFQELGSARQVLLWMRREEVYFPRPSDGKKTISFDWQVARYRNVISLLKNPFYAGAYAYGKSETRTEVVAGRARKSYGHAKPMADWGVLLKGHHEGYITWQDFERNQAQLCRNAYGKAGGGKSARGGRALLAGLLRCARCGRRLRVVYTGRAPGTPKYRCDSPNLMLALPQCMAFGAWRVDAAIEGERCFAPWRHWPWRRLWRLKGCKRSKRPKAAGSPRLSLNKPATKSRLQSGAMLPVIPTIASLQHSWRRAGKKPCGAFALARESSAPVSSPLPLYRQAILIGSILKGLPATWRQPGARQAPPCAAASGWCGL